MSNVTRVKNLIEIEDFSIESWKYLISQEEETNSSHKFSYARAILDYIHSTGNLKGIPLKMYLTLKKQKDKESRQILKLIKKYALKKNVSYFLNTHSSSI